VHFSPDYPLTLWSPKVTYIGAMLINCIEKANIIRMTRMLTMERAWGIVSRLLKRYSSSLKKFMPILMMPYRTQMKV